MNMEDYLKKRVLFFICSLISLSIVTICSTFAIMNSDINKSNYLVVANKNIEVMYLNDSESLSMSGIPYSIDEFAEVPSNVIKIINKTDNPTSYKISLKETSGHNFDITKIYYSIDSVSNRLNSNGEILLSDLPPNSTHIYDIRVWLGEDLITASDLGNKLSFTLKVTEIN